MKIILALLLCIYLTNSLFSVEYLKYPQALEMPVKKILSFPRAQEKAKGLYQKMGTIRIALKPFSVSTQNAMWNIRNKTIILNPKKKRNEGETIRSILFEMHNADTEGEFVRLNQMAKKGMIGRENYIRQVEYLEYRNVWDTIALLNEGIEQGYYPESARWYAYSDFERHYDLQKQVGHSQFIGSIYDRLVPRSRAFA